MLDIITFEGVDIMTTPSTSFQNLAPEALKARPELERDAVPPPCADSRSAIQ